ncbi:MAG TPA: YndJ family protein [Ardenticatenaceae bacterium]|nr:YndJ family protein [Ardenticatenaceae bacterium]
MNAAQAASHNRALIYAGLGALVWAGASLFLPLDRGGTAMIQRVLLLAILVLVPLALPLAATPDRSGRFPFLYHLAGFLLPVAAVLAVASFLLPAGVLAGLVASGWLGFSGILALFGLGRLLFSQRLARVDAICLDVALLYLPVGAVWFALARLGANPMGFGDTIVLLTAVHFHYTGFVALVIAGNAGRWLWQRKSRNGLAFQLAALGLIIGTQIVAAGITFSPLLEVLGTLVLSVSLWLLSFLTLSRIVPSVGDRVTQALMIVSAVSAAVAMLFAAGYALQSLTGSLGLNIPRMVVVHGLVNALGFALCGLLGWTRLRRRTE